MGCVLIFVVLMGVTVVVSLRMNPAGQQPTPESPAKRDADRPSRGFLPGDVAVLASEQNEVLVAVDDSAEERLLKYSRAMDATGVAQLVAQGRVLVAPAGTRVRIISPRTLTVEARILDGKYAGKEVIVINEFLQRQSPGRLSVSVVNTRIEPFKSNNKDAYAILVDVKNTGDRPVRVILATVKGHDAKGNEWVIAHPDYVIYGVLQNERGIAPGETYIAKPGEDGMLLLKSQDRPTRTGISVEITSVREQGLK